MGNSGTDTSPEETQGLMNRPSTLSVIRRWMSKPQRESITFPSEWLKFNNWSSHLLARNWSYWSSAELEVGMKNAKTTLGHRLGDP